MNAKVNGVEAGANYFTLCRKQGFSDPEIINELVGAGWKQSDINAAMIMAVEPEPTSKGNRWLWIILAAVVLALVVAVGVVAYIMVSGQLN